MGFRIGRKYASHTYEEPRIPGPPGPAPPGSRQTIRFRAGPGPGTYTSSTPLPAGAIVLGSSFDNDVSDDPANALFAANTDATIGTAGAPTLFQDATENTPDTANNYQNLLNILITGPDAGVVQAVIAGAASAGSASVTIDYVVTPQP